MDIFSVSNAHKNKLFCFWVKGDMFSALNIVQIQLSDVPGGRDES
jgi:hypothetical protein